MNVQLARDRIEAQLDAPVRSDDSDRRGDLDGRVGDGGVDLQLAVLELEPRRARLRVDLKLNSVTRAQRGAGARASTIAAK